MCVGGGVLDAPPYITQICIGAPLPLPSGEVAMPQGIDGEGFCRTPGISSPLPPSPRKGEIILKVRHIFTAYEP